MKVNWFKIIVYFGILFYTFYILSPIIWMILSSLLNEADLLLLSSELNIEGIFRPTLREYITAIKNTLILKAIADTTMYSAITAVLATLISAFTAYAYIYINFSFRKPLFLIHGSLQTIPGWSVAIPIYLLMRQLALFDTYFAIIFVQVGWCLPFGVWMLSSFLKALPKELEESAFVDGCSRLYAFLKIILPLSAPGLAAVLIWSFLVTWGEFGWPLILTATNISAITTTIAGATGLFGALYGLINAQGVLSIIPPVIIAVAFQRFLIKGLTAGAIKG
jgi:multiple sugar transport system permease protein